MNKTATVLATLALSAVPATFTAGTVSAQDDPDPTVVVTETSTVGQQVPVNSSVERQTPVVTTETREVDTDDDDDGEGKWGLLGLLGLLGLAGLAGLKRRRDDGPRTSTPVNADSTPRGSHN